MNIFEDSEGNASSMNFVWLLSLVTIIGTWILLSLKTGNLQHVTGGDALWFTSLFAGKIVQNFYEHKKPLPPSDVRAGILEDRKGKLSPARFIWVAAVLGIILTWAYLAWKHSVMQHFETGDAAWFTALFGSKVGATIVERGGLSDNEDEFEGTMFSRGEGGIMDDTYKDKDKDKLIAQLQETIRVQTDFNSNIVKKLNPIEHNIINDNVNSVE